MEGIVVKRFYGGNGGDDRSRLSVLSPVDLSPKVACVNLTLPSCMRNKYITCGSCCGLFYFDEFGGNIVLCNLTTKQLKTLPRPPKPKSKFRFELFATGLGYDSQSDDFKIIRFLQQPHYEGGRFQRYNYRCDLYSLKSGVWKDIPTPDAIVSPGNGVYAGGRCYWKASLSFSIGGSSSDHGGSDVVSFDFTTESFHYLHSPPSIQSGGIAFDLVEFRGSLGAVGFSRSDDPTRGFGFEFWVREECSWAKVFDVVLFNVERIPLGLIDGRFLFLERKGGNELCQLVVYDRINEEWKELDIYDYPLNMRVTSYVEGHVVLPGAMPMQRPILYPRRGKANEQETRERERERSDDDSVEIRERMMTLEIRA